MSRALIVFVVLIALIVGGLFLLAGSAREKPPVRVEKVIPIENLS